MQELRLTKRSFFETKLTRGRTETQVNQDPIIVPNPLWAKEHLNLDDENTLLKLDAV